MFKWTGFLDVSVRNNWWEMGLPAHRRHILIFQTNLCEVIKKMAEATKIHVAKGKSAIKSSRLIFLSEYSDLHVWRGPWRLFPTYPKFLCGTSSVNKEACASLQVRWDKPLYIIYLLWGCALLYMDMVKKIHTEMFSLAVGLAVKFNICLTSVLYMYSDQIESI